MISSFENRPRDGLKLRYWAFLQISQFLDRTLMRHIDTKNSLDSKLQFIPIYSIRTRSRRWDKTFLLQSFYLSLLNFTHLDRLCVLGQKWSQIVTRKFGFQQVQSLNLDSTVVTLTDFLVISFFRDPLSSLTYCSFFYHFSWIRKLDYRPHTAISKIFLCF